MAEHAIHISSNPPVPGRFYWTSDTQLRWRPQDFWPAGTIVNIDAGGTKSSFTVPEQLVATIDNKTLQMEVMRNGKLEKTFPVSMGKKGHDTPNGTYYVLEKFADIVDGLVHLRRARQLGGGLQDQGPGCGPRRQPGHVRAQRAVVGGKPRAKPT